LKTNLNTCELIKVCAYARVSTDSKEQQNSFENQQSYFSREINKSGYKLTKIYADEGLTGTKLYNKPQFNKMLYDAGLDVIETKSNGKKHIYSQVSERKPLFNEIWIKNTSRFARNTLSSEIIDQLRQKNVYINFIEQNINTKDLSQDFLLKLMQVFDEQDSKDKSSKVHWGHQEGARKGIIMTNSNIYGYTYIQAENRLEIVTHEAEVIQKIFKLYSEGLGIRRIINYLKENDIKTRKHKDFQKSTISKILDNEKYAGYSVRQKYDTGMVIIGKHYPKKRDKSEWIMEKNVKIPAIITSQLFDQCQSIRENKISVKNQKGIYKGTSEYAELIKCHNCGSNFTRNMDKENIFYNCGNKKKNGTIACNSINVKLDYLENAITLIAIEYYNYVYSSKKILIAYCEKVRKKIFEKLDQDNEEVISCKTRELDVLIEKLNKLNDMFFFQNSIDEQYYLSAKERFDIQIEDLKHEIRTLSINDDEHKNEIIEIENIINKIENIGAKKEYEIEEIKQEIISYEIRKAKDIHRMYQEVNIPEIGFKFKMNDQIKSLTDKYLKDINENEVVMTNVSEEAVIQIYSNGEISIYFRK